MILARRGMARCSLKLRMYVPRYFWLINHSYNWLELRKKRAAESNRNGVVGRIGKNIPIIPNTNDKQPNMISNTFIIVPFDIIIKNKWMYFYIHFLSHGRRGSNSKDISLLLYPNLIIKLLRFRMCYI